MYLEFRVKSYLPTFKKLLKDFKKIDNRQKTFQKNTTYNLGIQIQNMKVVFNFYCTWRWVMFEKLMKKIYDFFILLLVL